MIIDDRCWPLSVYLRELAGCMRLLTPWVPLKAVFPEFCHVAVLLPESFGQDLLLRRPIIRVSPATFIQSCIKLTIL